MGVITDGKSYGIPKDLNFSFPTICKNGTFNIVQNLGWDAFSKGMIETTLKEL